MLADDHWLDSVNRRVCPGCKKLISRRSKACTAYARILPPPPAPARSCSGTEMSFPEPAWSPTVKEILVARRPVMDTIPPGARTAVLSALGRVIANFTQDRTWENLRALVGFAKVVLASPDRSGRKHLPSITREVSGRALTYGVGSFEDLWNRTTPPARRQKKVRTHFNKPDDKEADERFISRVCQLVGSGAFSKACKHLVSAGTFNPDSDHIREKLRSLHPEEPEPDVTDLRLAELPSLPWAGDVESVEARLRGLESMIGRF